MGVPPMRARPRGAKRSGGERGKHTCGIHKETQLPSRQTAAMHSEGDWSRVYELIIQ